MGNLSIISAVELYPALRLYSIGEDSFARFSTYEKGPSPCPTELEYPVETGNDEIRAEGIMINAEYDLNTMAYLSRNLYNEANYMIRQNFFTKGTWIRKYDLNKAFEEIRQFQETSFCKRTTSEEKQSRMHSWAGCEVQGSHSVGLNVSENANPPTIGESQTSAIKMGRTTKHGFSIGMTER